VQYEVDIGGRRFQVAVTRTDGVFAVSVDGRTRHVDAVQVDAHTLSLLVDGAESVDAAAAGNASHEVSIAADPVSGQLEVHVGATAIAALLNGRRRWKRKEDGATSGPQRLVAPMPGKVVRVLVNNGDRVTARQPVMVVEAMKMENELRASRDGTVAELHAREGMSVDAGALLVVIQ
jgi:glutaconyl-CoA/methylmalonyl-CoA decarboxylase subunit gamma